jgi:hypothetical protein
MGNLINALNSLKSNIFGSKGQGGYSYGTGTALPRKTAIELADTNPLSPMDNDPFAFSSISYPRDMANHMQNGHYMIFYVNVQDKTRYTYRSGDGKGIRVGGKIVTTSKEVVSTGIDQEEANATGAAMYTTNSSDSISSGSTMAPSYAQGLVDAGLGGNLDSDSVDLAIESRGAKIGMSSYLNTTTRISDSIALYLPPNVEDTLSMGYNASATGMLGFLAASGAGIGKAWNENDFERLGKIGVGAAKGFLDNAAKEAALGLAEFVASAEGGKELFNKAFGRADNPYMEVLFDKPGMRTFSYSFTFAPRNTDERDDVQKIIRMFRFHMAPELRADHNRFMTLPSEFDIHYMYQAADGKASENDYYNKISTCVLSNCKVNYTPDGVKSFADGSPTAIKMDLTFEETEMMTKGRIDEGY